MDDTRFVQAPLTWTHKGETYNLAPTTIEIELLFQSAHQAWATQQVESMRPKLSADERTLLATAREEPARHTWLFSSAEAVANLVALDGAPAPGARAIATHPRIADRARQAGFTSVAEVSPRLAAVMALIQSMRP